ncbi:P-loop containing nucleoside triphosphate hydrolase protein [Mycena rosella]|uniref:P-loop containing nucleoside triphosphate hydrolase protein n=1 Tax=Mycena rosella TaxID=1033263 RepID=A0AAD7GXZ0_MYCRO|nr:P-loop containing nucleoside triphosphate hydrolase protein [Mycena rosella]
MNSKQPLLPSTVPSYSVPSEDKTSEPAVRRSEDVRRFTWGIFQVAYGAPVRHLSLSGLRESIRDFRHSAPSAWRLLVAIYRTARTPVTVHLLAAMLLIIAPAFSLYISASILGIVEESVVSRTITESHVNVLQVLVFMWLFIAVMSTLAHRIMADSVLLKGYLRHNFLPQLVDASLRLDMAALQNRKALRSLPEEYGFDMEAPAFRFFHEVITRLRHFLTVVAEVGVLVMIISRREFHEAQLLAFFSFMLPAVMLFKPSTGVGGAGYVFWTDNVDYYYLAALYKLAFSHHFRPTLERDGMRTFISQEYRRVSNALGYMNVETLTIQAAIQVQWYWDILHSLIVDYPLALCALVLPWGNPLSSLVTMVIVQHATMTLQQSIYQLRGNQGPDTLAEVFGWAERLYEAVAFESELHRGTVKYPQRAEAKGMEVKFDKVSFSHRPDGPCVVSDVEFTIPAGSLALVVGANGSGKSSLLSLIPGLQQPSKGEIHIDGRPLGEYDIESVRGAMACLSQDEDMYPLSLRANMLMGATPNPEGDAALLKDAAAHGCATSLIERLPAKWDTILEPASVSQQCMQGCGNGYISTATMNELEAHGPSFAQTSVSGGEKQRLAATRLFARLLRLGERVRLIMCDEATGALDSCAEREILKNVKKLKGRRTAIFVTHRFGDLVKEADIILVMKEGRVAQSGTHAKLMTEEGGEYAKMYNAQANGFL